MDGLGAQERSKLLPGLKQFLNRPVGGLVTVSSTLTRLPKIWVVLNCEMGKINKGLFAINFNTLSQNVRLRKTIKNPSQENRHED